MKTFRRRLETIQPAHSTQTSVCRCSARRFVKHDSTRHRRYRQCNTVNLKSGYRRSNPSSSKGHRGCDPNKPNKARKLPITMSVFWAKASQHQLFTTFLLNSSLIQSCHSWISASKPPTKRWNSDVSLANYQSKRQFKLPFVRIVTNWSTPSVTRLHKQRPISTRFSSKGSTNWVLRSCRSEHLQWNTSRHCIPQAVGRVVWKVPSVPHLIHANKIHCKIIIKV